MPLKSETVDWIFARMLVRYGSGWAAKWAGLPMDAVAADWAQELERVPPRAIAYALGYLPLEFPPTVAQFKAICLRCPDPVTPALPSPKADPQKVSAIVGTIRARIEAQPRLRWAHALAAREEQGEYLTPVQSAAWRKALTTEPYRGGGTHTPIGQDLLPPGMRA